MQRVEFPQDRRLQTPVEEVTDHSGSQALSISLTLEKSKKSKRLKIPREMASTTAKLWSLLALFICTLATSKLSIYTFNLGERIHPLYTGPETELRGPVTASYPQNVYIV